MSLPVYTEVIARYDAAPADQWAIARAVVVAPGTQGMLIEAEAFAGNDAPIYDQKIYIPPNSRKRRLARGGAC